MGASASIISSELSLQSQNDADEFVNKIIEKIISKSPKSEMLINNFIALEKGKDAFVKFLRENSYASSNIKFLKDVEGLRKLVDDPLFGEKMDVVVDEMLLAENKYIVDIPDNLRQKLSGAVKTSRAGMYRGNYVQIMGVVNEIFESVLVSLSEELFPRFINSNFFKECQLQDELGITPEVLREVGVTNETGAFIYFQNALEAEADKINRSWIPEMMAATADLPKVSMCLATSSPKLPGFPLIFVNQTFEETTGYLRDEIVGQNCRFLQKGPNPRDVAEADSITCLSNALKDRRPVQVLIKNFKKDGTIFRNFLSMKPIYDYPGGHVTFVIGVQYEMTDMNDEMPPGALEMLDKIMDVIPDTTEHDEHNINVDDENDDVILPTESQ